MEVKKRDFATAFKSIDITLERFSEIQQRLSKVIIENKDFEKLIKSYDKADTLFYLDPPYYGTEYLYQVEFTTEDHLRLKNALDNIKGKFILSYNDCDFIQNLYKDYTIEKVSRITTLPAGTNKLNYNELVIKNY